MKNIALILGAFAGVGNRANATPVPDFNAGEGQGFHQTGVVSQKKDYKMPVEPDRSNPSQIFGNSYGSSQYPPMGPPYNHQDLGNFNGFNPSQYWPYNQNQASAYGQVYEQQPPSSHRPVPDQATDPYQSLNLNKQQDQQENEPSFAVQTLAQDRVLETSNTEPAENSEVIDSEVIDSEVIDSELINTELINTELINTELINSELIDSELIDAVVVFHEFDCDLHEMPSVEDAQKKIQKYFFNSAYRFNGLNSIKILKREGKKTEKSECDSMIVHYQASVLKSRSRTSDFFEEINVRIGLSFEDEYHSFGYQNKFDQLYAFKISDFMNGLINNLRDEIDQDVQNMIFANDYDVTTEHRRMEFSKLKLLVDDEQKKPDYRWTDSFKLTTLLSDKPTLLSDNSIEDIIDKTDPNLEKNLFRLKPKFFVTKTRDERKKDDRTGIVCKLEDGDKFKPDRTLVRKNKNTYSDTYDETCNQRNVFVIDYYNKPDHRLYNPNQGYGEPGHEAQKDPTTYEAIDDLLAVLGEEEFMNKFIGIGNKKIATEIEQIKSDKETKMKAAQYAIWKFVEDKTAREAEAVADLLPVAKKHVDDIEKLIEELTKQKKEIMEAENKPEDKNAGYNRWTKSLDKIEKLEETVKDLTKQYTDEHRKKELENAANDNLGAWLGMNGRPVQNKFWNWEWSG